MISDASWCAHGSNKAPARTGIAKQRRMTDIVAHGPGWSSLPIGSTQAPRWYAHGVLAIEEYGPVRALRQGRRPFGLLPPYMTVRCYAVDGLLVDAGLSCHLDRVLEWARCESVGRAVLTHHHEDHSGGAAGLKQAGLPVQASQRTRQWMRSGFSIRLYQTVIWGAAARGQLDPLGQIVETENHRFRILEAPGHCDDQVVLFEEDEGWMFSGDAFLAERVKYFRGDEDFAATVRSLKELAKLDFDALFCAHRPVVGGGRKALHGKLQHLLELEGRVRELHAKGLGVREVTREILGKEPRLLYLLTGGDLSKRNLVRSILHGPRPRPDAPHWQGEKNVTTGAETETLGSP